MKQSKKSFVLEAFGSLFSNAKAISCSKKSPIWLTILLFFVAVIIPVIPLTVNTARSYGSAFIEVNSSVFEKTMPTIALEMAKDGVNFLTVDENHEVGIVNDDDQASYKHVNANNNHVEMEVFFSAASSSNARQAFINSIADHKLVLSDAGDETTYYHSSYTIFFKNAVYCCIYKADSLDIVSYSTMGDYKSFKPGTNLVELLTTVGEDKYAPTTSAEITALVANQETNQALLKNWKTLFNKAYITARGNNTLYGSLIYFGVFTGLSFIMGFLLWVMTRGKNNPFNYLTLWACLKMEAWASVAPGLIGLILGFLFTQYAVMIFIMCLGMRVMWISMRQLKPEIQ